MSANPTQSATIAIALARRRHPNDLAVRDATARLEDLISTSWRGFSCYELAGEESLIDRARYWAECSGWSEAVIAASDNLAAVLLRLGDSAAAGVASSSTIPIQREEVVLTGEVLPKSEDWFDAVPWQLKAGVGVAVGLAALKYLADIVSAFRPRR